MGFEPTTAGATIQCSTPELRPPLSLSNCKPPLAPPAPVTVPVPARVTAIGITIVAPRVATIVIRLPGYRSIEHRTVPRRLARLAGLEPATVGLEGRCSIRLSYRRTSPAPAAKAVPNLPLRPESGPFQPACRGRSERCDLARHSWSGWQDSNLRPTAPKAVALPGCATPRRSPLVSPICLDAVNHPRRRGTRPSAARSARRSSGASRVRRRSGHAPGAPGDRDRAGPRSGACRARRGCPRRS